MSGARGGGELPAEAAGRVRLVVFDVDGVLTDGGVYLGRTASGEAVELKRFDIQDGLGIKMLEWAGVGTILVSGRRSEATALRAEELGVECRQTDGGHKMGVLREVLERDGISWDEVAMLADDLPDMAVFTEVGLPCAVANAQPEVVEAAAWVTTRRGGEGAVREFCRALLRARGAWDDAVRDYVDARR